MTAANEMSTACGREFKPAHAVLGVLIIRLTGCERGGIHTRVNCG